MTRIVLDSDGLIKLMRSGVLKSILSTFECVISEAVYAEAVSAGKQHLYEDAFKIEELIERDLLKVHEARASNVAGKILAGRDNLGEGEISTLHLYYTTETRAIISDDRAFLQVLYESKTPFITPTDLIVRMVAIGALEKESALEALENIRVYVNELSYLKAKNKLMEVI